jgi:hypothetical protein
MSPPWRRFAGARVLLSFPRAQFLSPPIGHEQNPPRSPPLCRSCRLGGAIRIKTARVGPLAKRGGHAGSIGRRSGREGSPEAQGLKEPVTGRTRCNMFADSGQITPFAIYWRARERKAIKPLIILGIAKFWLGCPTWIRTRTKGSKDPCATITPSDKAGAKLVALGRSAKSFFGGRALHDLGNRWRDFQVGARLPPSPILAEHGLDGVSPYQFEVHGRNALAPAKGGFS